MISKIWNTVYSFFKKILEKDFAIKILSLISAIIIWFIISVSVYPTIDRVIYNVPVKIEMSGTYAEAHNFEVVSQSDVSVTVYITGDRGDIGDLTAEELTVVASAENVLTATEYNLPLEVVCSSNRKFNVTKISPEYVSVDFDEISSKEVPITPDMSEIHIANGFISDVDDVVIVPNTVEITGPKDIIDTVTSASVSVEADGELSSTYEYTSSDITLYNNTAPVDKEADISLSKSSFTVHIPILQKQVLPVEVRVTNAPSSFDTEAFIKKLTLSVSELEVAVPPEKLKDITYLDIGSIDMREVDIGSVFTFYTSDFLPEGYQNLSGTETVTVTCPSEGLVKLPLLVRGNSIQIINAPSQYDYNIITSGFTQFFIGTQESMEQLTYIDVVAQIDLINYDLEPRDYKFPVTFSTPAYGDIWCIGSDGELSPKATVTVTLKEQ